MHGFACYVGAACLVHGIAGVNFAVVGLGGWDGVFGKGSAVAVGVVLSTAFVAFSSEGFLFGGPFDDRLLASLGVLDGQIGVDGLHTESHYLSITEADCYEVAGLAKGVLFYGVKHCYRYEVGAVEVGVTL